MDAFLTVRDPLPPVCALHGEPAVRILNTWVTTRRKTRHTRGQIRILGAVGAARENMALFTMAFFGGLWSPALGLGVRYIRQGRLGLEAPIDASVLVVADAHPNFVRAVEDGRAGGLPASAQPYEH